MNLEERAKAAFLAWDNAYQPGMDTWESIMEGDRENWRNVVRAADAPEFNIPPNNENMNGAAGQMNLQRLRDEVNLVYRSGSLPVVVIFGCDVERREFWIDHTAQMKVEGVSKLLIVVSEASKG
jgi:hypothetical protein